MMAGLGRCVWLIGGAFSGKDRRGFYPVREAYYSV
jgi:hypothetical protein